MDSITSSIEEALSRPMNIDASLEDIPVDAFDEPIDVLDVATEAVVSGEEQHDGEIAGPSRIPSSPDSNQQHGDNDDDAATRLDMAFDRAVYEQESTPTSRICKYTFTPTSLFLAATMITLLGFFQLTLSLSLSLSTIYEQETTPTSRNM